ncbi:MAG: prepilin-type N-terminal cleavage/methylation domain-containing protein [Gammaproteobacteria bacterium]|nr:prepilin-type N-terminal cleavage/methylation domain-containing protein [Gammaproteobacteria bacterium]MBQ0840930.1 prepilin-type N-terminal cleavage/methylation domain-containing protein [Gammaproteobacteria bacterium]
MQNKQTLNQQGFTLIEAMIVVAIIAIVLSLAAPSFNDFFEKNRLKRAAEEVYGLVTKARAEGVIRDADMSIAVDTGEWCVGYAATAGCDCTVGKDAAGACSVPVAGTNVLQVVNGANFSGVTIAETFAGIGASFDNVKGTAGTGRVSLSAGDWDLDVVVSGMGRVMICSPAGSTTTMGYIACPL